MGWLGLLALWVACSQEPPHIELGRDWNATQKVVADTSSTFHVNDPILIQLYNGQSFGHSLVQLKIYRGATADSSALLYQRDVSVKPSESSLVIRGAHGAAPLTARGLLRSGRAGVYTIEFELQGKVVASKQLELTRAQGK